jgi:putative phosphoesterase
MKLALLGDIHGNDLALRTVLDAAYAAKVDRLLVTGDLIGYYFEPLKVLKLLSNWHYDVVSGNHEKMLCDARNDPLYLAKVEGRYGSGIRIALEQLNSEQLDKLCTLPHPLELRLDDNLIMLSHGSPWNFDQYIYPDADQKLLKRCFLGGYDLIVMGHTHYPMLKQFEDTLLINPGSVGQPRDRPGACWALYDTATRTAEFHRESYDSSSLVRECKLRHPNLPYLAEILERI